MSTSEVTTAVLLLLLLLLLLLSLDAQLPTFRTIVMSSY